MQQDQCIAFDRKQYPRTTQADMGAYFLQAWIKFPDQRHSHRPAILSGLDVFSDCFTVFSLEFLEPVSDRLVTAFCAMENDCQDGLVLSRIEFQAPGVSKWSARQGIDRLGFSCVSSGSLTARFSCGCAHTTHNRASSTGAAVSLTQC